MINFVLYEDGKEMRERYKKIILKLIGPNNNNFKIIEIDKYNQEAEKKLSNIVGNKIYLLDVEVPGKSGLDLARKIRNDRDWYSQIIVITSHEQYSNIGYTSKLLMLDFISKYSNIEKELKETLGVAVGIFTKQKSITFTLNGELYQIPYNQILYIEKSLNNNNCKIVTNDGEYFTRDTIQHLEEILSNDQRFMKTHRSCIVNLSNVSSIDLANNIIFFPNKQIDLIARNKKRELKERL